MNQPHRVAAFLLSTVHRPLVTALLLFTVHCSLVTALPAATVSELGETWNTTAGDQAVTATPAVDDLIVIIAGSSGMAGPDNISVADNQGGAYTQIVRSTGGGSQGMLDIWIRDTLVSAAVSTIYTATIGGNTGGGLTVLKVTGMTRTGADAAKQFCGESSQTESPVVCALGATPLAGNPLIAGVFGEDNPAALGAPNSGGSAWTETTDTGYATPISGIWGGFLSAGEADDSVTWTSGDFTDHNEVMVELDTSETSSRKRVVISEATQPQRTQR